jgi:hypothetical protein
VFVCPVHAFYTTFIFTKLVGLHYFFSANYVNHIILSVHNSSLQFSGIRDLRFGKTRKVEEYLRKFGSKRNRLKL